MTEPLATAKLSAPMQREDAAALIVNFVEKILKQDITPNPVCSTSIYLDSNNFD